MNHATAADIGDLHPLTNFPCFDPDPAVEILPGGTIIGGNAAARRLCAQLGYAGDDWDLLLPPDVAGLVKLTLSHGEVVR